jgi:integrase
VLPHVGLAKWLEADELADLLDACTDKSRWLVAVMALAGLRVSEAAALRWRSVDLASGRLTVETSKTETSRRVIADLNPELGGDERARAHVRIAFVGGMGGSWLGRPGLSESMRGSYEALNGHQWALTASKSSSSTKPPLTRSFRKSPLGRTF